MPVDFASFTEQLVRTHSRRLALRPVCLADAWPLFKATRNPQFNAGLLWDQPDHEDLAVRRIDAIMAASDKGRMSALSAVVRDTGEWVSLYRFQPYARDQALVEMGVWTHDRFWHGKYSLELVRACIDSAFDFFEYLPALVGAASTNNRSSCKLMELAGMQPTSMVIRHNEAGSEVPLLEFELSRTQWLESRPAPRYVYVPPAAPSTQPTRPIAEPLRAVAPN